MKGTSPQCVAFDPSNPTRGYCVCLIMDYGIEMMVEEVGTGSERRKDSSNDSISSRTQVMSVSVSHIQKGRKNGFNTVYVGT